jgi:hypothetical protein
MTEVTEEVVRHRAMIEEALKDAGYDHATWRTSETNGDRIEAVLGRFVVTVGDNDNAPYIDSEGEVSMTVVGAPEYRNERVMVAFIEDGYDSPEEVDINAVEPVQ